MAKREDRIREAASLQVKIGQLQRYCELMVELGEVNLRTLKPSLHRTRDKKRKAICFMLENLAEYFLRIDLSKGQARLMTYLFWLHPETIIMNVLSYHQHCRVHRRCRLQHHYLCLLQTIISPWPTVYSYSQYPLL